MTYTVKCTTGKFESGLYFRRQARREDWVVPSSPSQSRGYRRSQRCVARNEGARPDGIQHDPAGARAISSTTSRSIGAGGPAVGRSSLLLPCFDMCRDGPRHGGDNSLTLRKILEPDIPAVVFDKGATDRKAETRPARLGSVKSIKRV